jgi:hypothetical protein
MRYGENESGKWVRSSAFREIDYDPEIPDKLREFNTFNEAFEFDEECRLHGTGGRKALHKGKPRASVPREQLVLEKSLKHAISEDGNETRVQLEHVEDCIHGELAAIKADIKALLAGNDLKRTEVSGRFAWIPVSPINLGTAKFYYDQGIDDVFQCAESGPPLEGIACELVVVDVFPRDCDKLNYTVWEENERYGVMQKKDILKFSDNVKIKHGSKLNKVQEKFRDLNGIALEEQGKEVIVKFKDYEPRTKRERKTAVFKVVLLEWLCPEPLPEPRCHVEREEGGSKAELEWRGAAALPAPKKSPNAKAKAKAKPQVFAGKETSDPGRRAHVISMVEGGAETQTSKAHVEDAEQNKTTAKLTAEKLSVGNDYYLTEGGKQYEQEEATSRPKKRRRLMMPETMNTPLGEPPLPPMRKKPSFSSAQANPSVRVDDSQRFHKDDLKCKSDSDILRICDEVGIFFREGGREDMIQRITARRANNADLKLKSDVELSKICDVLGIFKRNGGRNALIERIIKAWRDDEWWEAGENDKRLAWAKAEDFRRRREAKVGC